MLFPKGFSKLPFNTVKFLKIELRAVKVIGTHLRSSMTVTYGKYPIQLYPQKLLFFLSVIYCTKMDILKLRRRTQTKITNLYQELKLFNDRWQFIYHVKRLLLWIWTSKINQYFRKKKGFSFQAIFLSRGLDIYIYIKFYFNSIIIATSWRFQFKETSWEILNFLYSGF